MIPEHPSKKERGELFANQSKASAEFMPVFLSSHIRVLAAI
jgi:hypothetical protein